MSDLSPIEPLSVFGKKKKKSTLLRHVYNGKEPIAEQLIAAAKNFRDRVDHEQDSWKKEKEQKKEEH